MVILIGINECLTSLFPKNLKLLILPRHVWNYLTRVVSRTIAISFAEVKISWTTIEEGEEEHYLLMTK